jgi:hypothetical protein
MDCDIPENPSKKVPTTTSADEVPSSYSSHLFHYALAHKVHEMLSQGANKRHLKDYGVIQKFVTRSLRCLMLYQLSFGPKTLTFLGTYGAHTCPNNASAYQARLNRFSWRCTDHTLYYTPQVDKQLFKLRFVV